MDKFTPLLAKEFSRREEHIENILRLLDEGNTVPFIARYRKEMHGTTDDQTIPRHRGQARVSARVSTSARPPS